MEFTQLRKSNIESWYENLFHHTSQLKRASFCQLSVKQICDQYLVEKSNVPDQNTFPTTAENETRLSSHDIKY